MKTLKNVIIVFVLFFIGCKKQEKEQTSRISKEVVVDTMSNMEDIIVAQDTRQNHDTLFLEDKNFNAMLNKIKQVKHTRSKYGDWMTNKSHSFYEKLFELSDDSIVVSTTSYTYKQKCKFYVHTLKHVNDTVSIQPYIKNAIGKKTGGYMKVRFLFFAKKDFLKAHFIDIPPNYGHAVLKDELIEKIYDRMDIVAMYCKYADLCELKDFNKR